MSCGHDRRFFLTSAGAAAFALSLPGEVLAQAFAGLAEGRVDNAFNARNPETVYAALNLSKPRESADISIEAPDVAENGANVPVEVSLRLSHPTRVLVIGERNIFPLLADVRLSARALPWFELKIRLAETSDVRVIAFADGGLYTAKRSVKVIVGGCLPG